MKIVQPGAFEKDIKRQRKRGKDIDKLKLIIEMLINGGELPERCMDHPLAGNWTGWRDCHVEPDWLLIYKVSSDALTLGRTGSHSDLF